MTLDRARGTSQNSETSQNFSENDYATWLTKQQAADRIGVSTKTIEAFAKDGKIQQAAWRPQGRGAAQAVYHPDDVARIAAERRGAPSAFVLPAGVTSPVTAGNGNGHGHSEGLQITHASSPTGEEILRLVFTAALQRLTSETSQTSEKLFLTVNEAAAWSGLTPRDLRRAIRSGELAARHKERSNWRTWRIRRKDLEAL